MIQKLKYVVNGDLCLYARVTSRTGSNLIGLHLSRRAKINQLEIRKVTEQKKREKVIFFRILKSNDQIL